MNEDQEIQAEPAPAPSYTHATLYYSLTAAKGAAYEEAVAAGDTRYVMRLPDGRHGVARASDRERIPGAVEVRRIDPPETTAAGQGGAA